MSLLLEVRIFIFYHCKFQQPCNCCFGGFLAGFQILFLKAENHLFHLLHQKQKEPYLIYFSKKRYVNVNTS